MRMRTVIDRLSRGSDYRTGVCRRHHANEDDDDGILGGMEVGGKNLSGVELVILSECHTARGRIVESENLPGMQRTVPIDGYRTVAFTLWPIAARPMILSMQRFYRNLLRDRMSESRCPA